MLLCDQNFRDVWSRNESVRAEIGQILLTDAAKLVVAIFHGLLDPMMAWNIKLYSYLISIY